MPILNYSMKDHPIDFVNKVSVRGQAGSYGVAEDSTSIDRYGVIKERTVDDSSLTNSIQCENKAQALLSQYTATNSGTIRECVVTLSNIPTYS